MKELICIVCPRGCHLQVDTENGYKVIGNACARGPAYAIEELTNPKRTVTSTVKIQNTHIPRLPVKTSADIPKQHIFDAMALLNDVVVSAPVCVGDVIIPNILNLGIDFIATRDLPEV